MQRRTRLILLAVLLALCASAAIVFLRMKAPPAIAQLLPECDAIVFLNLKPVRAATHFDRNPSPRAPAFQQFIDATGIVPERDVDSAVFALHHMQDPSGPNGPTAFSEIFRGRFDSPRLTHYLASLASSQESYAGHILYSIPSEGRTLRVTLLDSDMIAASNMPTPEQIHSMLDRRRTSFFSPAGPSLLNARFGDVPALSSVWAIGQLALPLSAHGQLSAFGVALPLSAESTFVASLRFTTALHLRIDQMTRTDAEATQSVQSLTTLLLLLRNLQPTARSDEEVALRQFVESISIQQHGERASLTATIPPELLKHLDTLQPAAP